MFGKNKSHPEAARRRQSTETPAPVPTNSQFRRNRTMSGIRREDVQTSERTKYRELTARRQRVGGILLIVFLGIGVLAILITQLIAQVAVTGSTKSLVRTVDAARYEQLINDYFGVHPVERLRFALNESELSDYVSTLAPEVGSIKTAGTENVIKTRFVITFREPVAGWQINNRQYYVDESGTVFENNYYAAPKVQIVDQSGISPEQGSTVASSRLLSFVGRVVALAGQGRYTVTEVRLPIGTTRMVEVKVAEIKTLTKLSIDRGAGEQVEDMTRALDYFRSRKQSPQYVDVRVLNRAVYR